MRTAVLQGCCWVAAAFSRPLTDDDALRPMQVCQDLREVSRRTRFPQPLCWMYKLPMTRRASLTTNMRSSPEQVRQGRLLCRPGLNTLTCIGNSVSLGDLQSLLVIFTKHQSVQDFLMSACCAHSVLLCANLTVQLRLHVC